jgi:hypothetical protein
VKIERKESFRLDFKKKKEKNICEMKGNGFNAHMYVATEPVRFSLNRTGLAPLY